MKVVKVKPPKAKPWERSLFTPVAWTWAIYSAIVGAVGGAYLFDDWPKNAWLAAIQFLFVAYGIYSLKRTVDQAARHRDMMRQIETMMLLTERFQRRTDGADSAP